MNRRAVLALAAATVTRPATARARGRPTGYVTVAAPGGLLWQAWQLGEAEDRSVLLTVVGDRRPLGADTPHLSWEEAYAPRLRPPRGWTHAGRPVVALTVSHGAAAETVAVVALHPSGRPERLVERLANGVGWRRDASGRDLLVLLERPTAAVVPACHAWDHRGLRQVSCPGAERSTITDGAGPSVRSR